MTRSPLFADVIRSLRIAQFCEQEGISTRDGVSLARNADARRASLRRSRREWLKTVGGVSAAGVAASLVTPVRHLLAAEQRGFSADVAIVGAGLAGLACADALAGRGIAATIYDANTRTGGRCWSLRGFFPGQIAERGGELIDNLHKTMIGYAQRFGLELDDVLKEPGDITYYFGGRHIAEAEVVEEFREFIGAMRIDLRTLSQEVSALSHTPADEVLDHTSLAAYLGGQNGANEPAGPIARAAIAEAYVAEFGLEPDQQSSLNFLLFVHADRRSKFTPFGVFSDERYHIVDGNDRIVEGLTQALMKPVEFGMRLIDVRRTSSGRIALTFDTPGGTVTETHEIVVLTIPFSVLRGVTLHTNLNIPQTQRDAINSLGYGTNAKMMIGFGSRPWLAHDGNGTSFSDLPNCQTTWETNPDRATATRAVLTDYSGGDRGDGLNPGAVQLEAGRFVSDLDVVFPGAAAAASRRANGTFLAHLEHWPSNPLTRGSYTCYEPGQFTTMAGLEGIPVGNLFFAGEHANSFYDWQGFMEGAALSGIEVADAILRAVRRA